MKNLAQAEIDFLRSRCLTLALCWRLTRVDGQVFRYTSHEQPITLGAETFQPTNGFEASAIESKAGLAVDNLTMTALTSDDIPEEDLMKGLWDRAQMDVFACDWTNPVEIPLRRGYLGQVTLKGSHFEVEVRGLAQKLNQETVEVYSRTCRALLGDTKCTVDLAPFTVTSTVTEVQARNSFYDSARTEQSQWFRYGLLTWTTGLNAGLKIEVLYFHDGYFELWDRMPYPIKNGDGYTVYAGCDKLLDTCHSKFGNTINFRGEPGIPGVSKAMKTPDVKG